VLRPLRVPTPRPARTPALTPRRPPRSPRVDWWTREGIPGGVDCGAPADMADPAVLPGSRAVDGGGMAGTEGAPATPEFRFEARRARLDWRLLHAVDVDRVMRENDIDTLESALVRHRARADRRRDRVFRPIQRQLFPAPLRPARRDRRRVRRSSRDPHRSSPPPDLPSHRFVPSPLPDPRARRRRSRSATSRSRILAT